MIPLVFHLVLKTTKNFAKLVTNTVREFSVDVTENEENNF